MRQGYRHSLPDGFLQEGSNENSGCKIIFFAFAS
jgi:hypothetical protein